MRETVDGAERQAEGAEGGRAGGRAGGLGAVPFVRWRAAYSGGRFFVFDARTVVTACFFLPPPLPPRAQPRLSAGRQPGGDGAAGQAGRRGERGRGPQGSCRGARATLLCARQRCAVLCCTALCVSMPVLLLAGAWERESRAPTEGGLGPGVGARCSAPSACHPPPRPARRPRPRNPAPRALLQAAAGAQAKAKEADAAVAQAKKQAAAAEAKVVVAQGELRKAEAKAAAHEQGLAAAKAELAKVGHAGRLLVRSAGQAVGAGQAPFLHVRRRGEATGRAARGEGRTWVAPEPCA